MGKTDIPECPYCPGTEGSSEHTFFRCPHWEISKNVVIGKLRVFSVELVILKMLEGEDAWDAYYFAFGTF